MSTVSNTANAYAESMAVYNNTSNVKNNKSAAEEKIEVKKNGNAENAGNAENTETKKVKVSGRTVGNPMLSETAAKYYEELKRKYGNMDFILVSADQKEYAKANASKYGNANKMVVLIDEEKIERMAVDEKYRKQYESVIANAASGLTQLKERLAKQGIGVKSYGVKVNDNGAASFFATMDKNFKTQNKRIEEKRAAKKAAKKAEEKKAQKKKQQEKLEESRKESKESSESKESDEILFEANSIDELLQKIEDMDYTYVGKDKSVLSEMEKKVGQQFDFGA